MVQEGKSQAYRLFGSKTSVGALLLGVAGLTSCAEGVSTPQRADAGTEADAALRAAWSEGVSTHVADDDPERCSPLQYLGFGYAGSHDFWLGSQVPLRKHVAGFGYLAAGAVDAPTLRYAAEATLSIHPSGILQDEHGLPVMGFAHQGQGLRRCLSPLLAPVISAAEATSVVRFQANFDASAQELPTPWDPVDPSATSNYSVSFTVIDSRGEPQVLEIYFRRDTSSTVHYYVTTTWDETLPGVQQLSEGTLTFDADGALLDAQVPAFSVDFPGADPQQGIQLWFGDDVLHAGGSGVNGVTQFEGACELWALEKNGAPAGAGADFVIGADGEVSVLFDSGVLLQIGVLALARFPVEAALEPNGDGSFSETFESGTPQFAAPQTPGRGSLE